MKEELNELFWDCLLLQLGSDREIKIFKDNFTRSAQIIARFEYTFEKYLNENNIKLSKERKLVFARNILNDVITEMVRKYRTHLSYFIERREHYDKNSHPKIIILFLNYFYKEKKNINSLLNFPFKKEQLNFLIYASAFTDIMKDVVQIEEWRENTRRAADKELSRRKKNKKISLTMNNLPRSNLHIIDPAIELMEKNGESFSRALTNVCTEMNCLNSKKSIEVYYPRWCKKQIENNGSLKKNALKFLKLHQKKRVN